MSIRTENDYAALVEGWSFAFTLATLLVIGGSPISWAQTRVDERTPQQAASDGRRLPLGLKQAVDMALTPEGNARIQLAEEMIRQAESRYAQSRAALLPDFEASIGQQNQTRNLASFGLQFSIPIPGFVIPRLAGPFNTFDARATVGQTIFDLSAIRRFQASRAGVGAARAENVSAQDQVAGDVARAYLGALRADTDLAAVKANIILAEALLKLAMDQKEAGAGTGIDVTRARVQLSNERQRLLVAENERTRSHLQLLKAIGLGLDIKLELTDALSYLPAETVTLDQAMITAFQYRSDLNAQQQRQESARLNYGAAKMERLPSIYSFADYGSTGLGINNAIPTRTYGLSVRVPVFDGGRRDARQAESLSLLRQERIKTRDLQEQIELEIRVALDSLRSAKEQVRVAGEGLALAQQEMAQARRRYEAGITNSIEVTDAQTRLERARDNQTAALYNHHLARINLGLAMGTIRQMIN